MKNKKHTYFLCAEFLLNFMRSATFIYIAINIVINKGNFGFLALMFAVEATSLFISPILASHLIERHGAPKALLKIAKLTAATTIIFFGLELSKFDALYLCYATSIFIGIFTPIIKITSFSAIPYVYEDNDHIRNNAEFVIAMQAGQLFGMAIAPLATKISFTSFFFAFLMTHILIYALQSCALRKSIYINNQNEKIKFNLFSPIKGMNLKDIAISSTDLIVVSTFNFGLVIVVAELMDGKANWLSTIEIAIAITAIIMAKLMPTIKAMKSRWAIILSPAFFSLAFLFASIKSISAFVITCILFVASQTISNISWKATIHRNVQKHHLGRISVIRGFFSAAIIYPAMFVFYNIQILWKDKVLAGISVFGLILIAINISYLLKHQSPENSSF